MFKRKSKDVSFMVATIDSSNIAFVMKDGAILITGGSLFAEYVNESIDLLAIVPREDYDNED